MASRTETLWTLWRYFNRKYFGGKLTPPSVIRITKATKYQGALVWRGTGTAPHYHLGHQCRIHISANQTEKKQIGALLHEMVHQYQLQVLREPPNHGPRFNSYCRWIERQTRFKLR